MTVPVVEGSNWWTFQAVEERMEEAWRYLMRMPDGEAAWLRSCSRSSMPAIMREARKGDTLETRPGRTGLRSAQVDLVELLLTGPEAWINWVVPRDRSLVATVLRLRGRKVGFDWRDVADSEGGLVGAEALRKRYSRAMTGIAVRLNGSRSALHLLP
ncbi:hypothetical protein ACQKE8_12935 [Sphingobium limneticum]|uniref:hypothetical protein n=1 Tax=Sphingobium limneticum TaxID=1007511 RepID=UPI003D016AF4